MGGVRSEHLLGQVVAVERLRTGLAMSANRWARRRATSKVERQFNAAAEAALGELFARYVSALGIAVLTIDRRCVADQMTCRPHHLR